MSPPIVAGFFRRGAAECWRHRRRKGTEIASQPLIIKRQSYQIVPLFFFFFVGGGGERGGSCTLRQLVVCRADSGSRRRPSGARDCTWGDFNATKKTSNFTRSSLSSTPSFLGLRQRRPRLLLRRRLHLSPPGVAGGGEGAAEGERGKKSWGCLDLSPTFYKYMSVDLFVCLPVSEAASSPSSTSYLQPKGCARDERVGWRWNCFSLARRFLYKFAMERSR